jgi:dihydroorotase
MKLVDDSGQLHDFAKRAWDSGVIMDIGHGTGSFSFETAESLMAAGRNPDVISTDLHQLSANGPAYDLPTCMSKFLHLGMSTRDVIQAVTSRPAEILGIQRDAGTLRLGSAADIALFRRHAGRFPLYDIAGAVREARELLVNTLTIIGGRPLDLLPSEPSAPWVENPIWPVAQQPFTERQRLWRELGHTPAAMAAAAERGETANAASQTTD